MSDSENGSVLSDSTAYGEYMYAIDSLHDALSETVECTTALTCRLQSIGAAVAMANRTLVPVKVRRPADSYFQSLWDDAGLPADYADFDTLVETLTAYVVAHLGCTQLDKAIRKYGGWFGFLLECMGEHF